MGKFKERRKEIKKVPLKDRPGWQKFKSMIPGLASGIASIFPGGKIISTIIDGITTDPDLSQETKIAALEFLDPIEQEEINIDLVDAQAAREAEIARMESPDWLVRNIVPCLAILWTVFDISLHALPMVHKIPTDVNIGTVDNITMLIIGYYFGSAVSNRLKDKTIQAMSAK